jgi:hypothetical protein
MVADLCLLRPHIGVAVREWEHLDTVLTRKPVPQQGGLEARRRPEAPAVPRADPAPTAATSEEVATRVAKKAARNKQKNKARSERRQRKREAMNSGGGEQGGRYIAPPPRMAWTSVFQSQLRRNRRQERKANPAAL